ncbi:MAG: aspartate kinase [Bryobacteraceae bacterium]|nr:aspartate kinase [Solibacteraceae bacterium]MCL4843903.1 aspartate kinase [Bryobacteraceae bacterium]MCO5353430.1 aspartate kinase [Bryobacteraceae bacterium]
MNQLVVMKFGGTSMGSAERIKGAALLCEEQYNRRPTCVVVSAMSKVTDLLLDTLRHAEGGDAAGVETNLQTLESRHRETCLELLDGPLAEETLLLLSGILNEFGRIARGVLMLGERPPRSVDEAIAVGERLSSTLIAAYLRSRNVDAFAVNARDLIVTDAVFGNAAPLLEPTREKAENFLKPELEAGRLPVVTGFNGATLDGRPTTLGRGGSDFSASILAAVLDAEELWIWTDVDGIMSADPRIVPDARVLDEITYREAAELAYNGAKVLHPRTLAPLMEREIPVWSKNSFRPEIPGTRIVPTTADTPSGARAVTSMNNVALVSLEPASALLSGTKVMARAIEALAATNAEVLALSSSSYRQNFCFLIRQAELPAVVERLEQAFSLELAHGYLHPIDIDLDVGLLAIVGEGMKGQAGLAGRIFTAISREMVNIIAIAQGSSELTIAIVVRKSGVDKAVLAVHRECGLSAPAAL